MSIAMRLKPSAPQLASCILLLAGCVLAAPTGSVAPQKASAAATSLGAGSADANSGGRANPFGAADKSEAAQQGRNYAAMQAAERRQLWAQWKQEFKKTYKDAAEENVRFKVFDDKLNEIAEHNVDESRTFWLGLNQFSDMPFEEFALQVLMKELPPRNVSMQSPEVSQPFIPSQSSGLNSNTSSSSNRKLLYAASANWKTAGKVTSVKNQGSCGSCWAFSATAAVESLMLINYGANYDLSEQQLVDCTYTYNGCNGGWPSDAMEHVYYEDQILEANYPYKSAYGSCRTDLVAAAKLSQRAQLFTNPGYAETETWSLTSMLNAISKQPITMGIQVKSSFQSYTGGIYTGPDCNYYGGPSIDHVVLATGYDISAGVDAATSYIELKNSWGSTWGSSGYMKIKTCGDGCTGYCYTNYYGSYPKSTVMPGPGDLATTNVYSTYTGATWTKLSAEYLRLDQCASLCYYTYPSQCAYFTWLNGYLFDTTTNANCLMVDYKAVVTNNGANYGGVSGRVASMVPKPPPPALRPPPPRPPPPPATYVQETSTAYSLTTVANEVFKNTTSATNCLNDCLATSTCSVFINSGTAYMVRTSPSVKFNCYLATAKVSFSYKSLTGYTSGKVASRMPA